MSRHALHQRRAPGSSGASELTLGRRGRPRAGCHGGRGGALRGNDHGTRGGSAADRRLDRGSSADGTDPDPGPDPECRCSGQGQPTRADPSPTVRDAIVSGRIASPTMARPATIRASATTGAMTAVAPAQRAAIEGDAASPGRLVLARLPRGAAAASRSLASTPDSTATAVSRNARARHSLGEPCRHEPTPRRPLEPARASTSRPDGPTVSRASTRSGSGEADG